MPLIRVTDEGLRRLPVPLASLFGVTMNSGEADVLGTLRNLRTHIKDRRPNSRVTPQYPFWHLRSSGLWDVEGIDTHECTPTPSQLAASGYAKTPLPT
ncbi:hypothetical protein ABZX72_17555 [Streptomyces cyaneofuscatus]|uniref:hypothetical protein n=1 Tax=Streptomyces cyaneofuscatus TaxID=66883 RepID=UPI0033AD28EC